VLTGADILEMQQVVTQVEVDDSLIKYALDIVRRTRQHEKLTLGVSPRGSQMLYRAAQAMAFLDGRGFCVPEDFKPLAVPVFAHRVAIHGMHSSGMKKSVRAEEVIQEIVDSVPVPV
jgi:MoxR-like ATPase